MTGFIYSPLSYTSADINPTVTGIPPSPPLASSSQLLIDLCHEKISSVIQYKASSEYMHIYYWLHEVGVKC